MAETMLGKCWSRGRRWISLSTSQGRLRLSSPGGCLPGPEGQSLWALLLLMLAEESIRKAISRVRQLDAELGDFARTIVQEVLETVKKKSQQETKSEQTSEKLQPRKLLPPLRLPPPVSPSEEGGKFKKSSPTALPPLPRGAEQDARRPADGLQKPRDGTSGATARSAVPEWETLRMPRAGSTAGSLPSPGPQVPLQPRPPAGPEPPPQARARHSPVILRLVHAEPVQPEVLERAGARSLVDDVLRSCGAPEPKSPRAATPRGQ